LYFLVIPPFSLFSFPGLNRKENDNTWKQNNEIAKTKLQEPEYKNINNVYFLKFI
jgi:hypothetical protein